MAKQHVTTPSEGSTGLQSSTYARFGKIVRRWYRKLQRPCVFTLLAIAVFAKFLNQTQLLLTSLAALGVILLELLLEIHHRLIPDDDRPTIVTDFYGASELMRDQIHEIAKRRKTIHIRALGMSMSHAWPFLKQSILPLLQSQRNLKVTLEIAMLDPQWQGIDSFNATWRDKASLFEKDFAAFKDDHSKLIRQEKWSLTVSYYRHLPNWHGILIDDRFLYLSSCIWTPSGLTGAENPYEIIDSQRSASEQMRVCQYLSWFKTATPAPKPKT